MSDNLAVFTVYNDKYIIIHIKKNRAEHIYVYPDHAGMDPGTIINCRIERNVDNIASCFARFSPDDTAFVPKALKNGSVMPLMYKKEATDGKKAVFTDHLTIDGEYAVVSDKGPFVKVSSKIPSEKKEEITAAFAGIANTDGVGIIVRTRAYLEENGIKKAKDEVDAINRCLVSLRDLADHLTAYTVLYKPLPQYIKDLIYLEQCGIEEIVTDRKDIIDLCKADHDSFSGPVNISDRVSLRFYEDSLVDLCHLYSFNAKISEALSRKVYLKSGAYITFDQTEALTAVDVNSSGYDQHSDREDTFYRINMEAAHEIARQLRLRNISGMVIVDFINMDNEEHYELLEKCLKEEFAGDRVNCRFVDFTGLHLAEIVRQRMGKTLYQYMRS